MLFEIETGRVYKMTKPNDIYSGFGALDKLDKQDVPSDSDPSNEPIDSSHSDDVIEAQKQEEESTEYKQKDLLDVIVEETEHDEDDVQEGPTKEEAVAASNDTAVKVNGGLTAAAAQDSQNQRERAVIQAIQRAETVCESYCGVQVYPLTGSMSATLSKAKFEGHFDGVFVSSRAAQIVGEQWFHNLSRSQNSMYVVETGKYLVSVSKDVQAEVAKKEVELAVKAGLIQVTAGAPIASRKRDALDTEEELLFFRRAA